LTSLFSAKSCSILGKIYSNRSNNCLENGSGWLLAGWEPVLLIDPGGDGKQEITKYFLTPLGVPLCDTTP
jgi:hypothetical protein